MATKTDLMQTGRKPIDATRGFYMDAYGYELSSIWFNTPFRNEYRDMAYHRAMSCMLRSNQVGEHYRRQLLYSYLKPIYKTDSALDSLNEHFDILPTDNTYVVRAIRNLCTLYNKPPKRVIEIDGKPVKQNDTILEILDNSDFNTYMRHVYWALKLTNEIVGNFVIHPNEKLKWRYFYKDKVRIIYDAFDNIQEIWIHHATVNEIGDEVDRFWVWTEDSLTYKDEKGMNVPFNYSIAGKEESYENYVNRYKTIPYKELKLDNIKDDTQGVSGGDLWELVKAQISYNKYDNTIDEIVDYQGFPLRIFSDFADIEQDELVVSPGSIIFTKTEKNVDNPMPASVETVEAANEHTALEDLKLRKIKQVLKNLELPPSIIDDNIGLPESGVAMREMRKGLIEIRGEDIPTMKRIENDLIKMMLMILNNGDESPYKGQFNDYYRYKVSIDYAELDVSMEFEPLKMKYDYLLEKNYISPKEHYLTFTEDESVQTDEQLIKLVKTNKKYYEQLKAIYGQDNSGASTNTSETPSGGDRENELKNSDGFEVQSDKQQDRFVGEQNTETGKE